MMRVCWCILFVLPVLVGTCAASEQKYECTQQIQPFDIIRGSSLDTPTVDGASKEFIKCLKLPKTAVFVDFDFRVLKLGDGNGITSINDCRNRGEDSSLGHIRITNGQNDKNPFTCSDIKINTGESKPITWDERKPIISSDDTLVFNLTKGGSSTFGEVEYVIYTNVTSCPDIEGGNITRISQFNFTITCFGGQKGTDSSDNYTCDNGYWTQGGIRNKPSCYERVLKRFSEEHEEFKINQNGLNGRLAVIDSKLEEFSDVASEVVKLRKDYEGVIKRFSEEHEEFKINQTGLNKRLADVESKSSDVASEVVKLRKDYEGVIKRFSEEHEEFKINQTGLNKRLADVESKSSDVASEVVKIRKDFDDIKKEVEHLKLKLEDIETEQTYHNKRSYIGFTLLAIFILERVLCWIWWGCKKIIDRCKKEESNSYDTARYVRGGRIHQPVDDDDDKDFSGP